MPFAPVSVWRRTRSRWAVGAALLVLGACGGGGDGGGGTGVPVPASLALSAPSATISAIGNTSSVTATVRDAGGAVLAGQTVNWSSDAPAVASVSASGGTATITAVGRGVAVVTARTGAFSSGITVFVRSAFAVSISPNTATLRVGNTTTLQALVSADEGVSTSVTWTSADPAVASVSAQGLVTAVAPGTAVVTARSVSDSRVQASATITVSPPRGVVIAPSTMDIGRAESRPLTAQVFVDQGSSTAVTWRTNRPLIATVSQQGLVTGVSDGDATITAVAVADTTLRATALVRVVPVVRSIVVSPTSAVLNIGQTRTFSAAIVVDQGASGAIAWSSSNPAVASVNAQGVATAIGVGTTSIRARSVADTTRESIGTLVVEARPVTLTLGQRTLGLTIGRTATLSATVSADPGVTTAVQWTSRNSAVATVSAQGVLTATGAGTTRVIAEAAADGSARDSLTVTVAPRLATSWSVDRLGGPLIEDIVSLWAANASLAYAVNSLGDVYRWNGTSWSNVVRGSVFGTSFRAVHGVSTTAVTAVGTNGVIAQFDGTTWSAVPSGTTASLDDIWMHSADTAWASGASGTVVRRAGATWATTSTGTTTRLRGVWGTGTSAYAVGDGGTIRRFQSGIWTPITSGTSEILHDVWAPAAVGEAVYVVGDFGTLLRWNGAEFEFEESGTSASLFALSGGLNNSVLASGDGVVLARRDGEWQDLLPPFRTRFSSASIDGTGAFWIGGQRGLVMRAAPSGAWSTLSLTPDLLDVWSSSASHALAVGELGFIFAFDGAGWTRQVAPSLERLNTVWAASPSVAYVGGDNGVLLRWTGTAWVEQPSPTTEHVYAMWGASATDVWAVTEGGEILHTDGTDWSVVHTQSQPLYGVYGTSPSDVHVVGLNGTALHWNGSSWSARSTGTAHVLVGLWAADANQAMTVGARDFTSGVTLRYNGSWSEVPAATPNILSAIWGAVGFDLYAVGDMGTVVRFDGTGWTTMSSGTSEFLWAITGAPDASGAGFAVGLNGVVLRAQGGGAVAAAQAGIRRGTPNSLAPARGIRPAQSRLLRSGPDRKGRVRRK
jgi:trimeric autotransporter adhesin